MTAGIKICRDCVAEGIKTVRPAPYPGPRCASHDRAVKKARSKATHARRVADVYGLLPGDYEALLEAQGGTCAILHCRAAGGTRRLAVEHDHKLEYLGREAVRGLACAVHNEWIGRAGDDPEVFESIAAYLRNPPARKVLTDRRADYTLTQ